MGASSTGLLQVKFIEPILGFENAGTFVLASAEQEGWFTLEELETRYPAFFLADAFAFFPDLDISVDDDIAARLGITDPAQATVFVIATASPGNLTANLAAPIVVNVDTGLAAQVIQDTPLPVAAPFGGSA